MHAALIGRLLQAFATMKRRAKDLRPGCRAGRMVAQGRDRRLTGGVEWAFNAARAPVNNRVRDCLQWRMPVDSVNDDHFLGIGRPFCRKRISSRIKRLYNFLEWTKVFAGAGVHKMEMEVV